MKAVLISIRPEWCALIAAGKKTVEVRKSMPKLHTPFKCYIYCTLPPRSELFTHGRIREYANELIRLQSGEIVYGYGMQLCLDPENRPYSQDNFLCRKIIGEFVCDGIECFTTDYRMNRQQTERIAKESCMDMIELAEYEYDSICLYGWHISELKIYGKPLELSQFRKPIDCLRGKQHEDCVGCWDCEIKRPPQIWCYVDGQTE